MYFLGDLRSWAGQSALWGFIARGALRIHAPADLETERMRVLMEKYADIPMDLADASLVAAAETRRIQRIFTFDTDFRVYRLHGTGTFEVVP
jgi:predicted nucleic acid-binding protein